MIFFPEIELKKIIFTAGAAACFFIYASGQTSTLTLSVNKYEPGCDLGSAKINVSGGTPPYFFQWSSGAAGDSVSSLDGGSYTVHVTDSGSHEADITFNMAAYACKVSIDTKFSPNGDGINDSWSIAGTDKFPEFLVEVFDRWGQLVHVQRHIYTPWNGTYLGVPLADATYYYVFYYEEGKPSPYEKGSVTILR